MKLIKIRFLLLPLLLLGLKGSAQFSTTIPLNQEVVSGTLKNGMKYYILHNEWPKERASFYFAQNVGAILEDDNQNGLAHFLEHMAFNGTKNFEGKALIDILEKNGVSFGRDINAYTAKDETVYNISNVPVKDIGLIDSTLLMLHDWSGFLSLKDSEIDAERGVITEEWRTRNSANVRFMKQTDKVLYKGSKYADRDVIGDMNIVKNFKYQELKDYYKKWYRPDLQAVIVVGDIDPKEIEKKIKKLFSTIPMPKNAAERYYVDIPDNKEMGYVLATDKEAQEVKINLLYKKSFEKVKSQESLKADLFDYLAATLLNRRYGELAQSGKSSAFAYGAAFGEIARLKNSFNLTVIPKPGKEKQAFRELMTEMERAARYGFTQSEMNRIKENVQSSYENALKNSNKIENNSHAEKIVSYFLTAAPFESLQKEYEGVKIILAGMTLNDLNTAAKNFQTPANNVLTVTGPIKKEGYYPSQSDYSTIMEEVKNAVLEKYKEDSAEQDLISDTLKFSEVAKQSAVKGIPDAKRYVLANGATVVLYPTKLAKDEILFSALSKGGSSLIKTEDIPSSQISVDLIESSGLAGFNTTQLQDKLNGKIVSIVPFIGKQTEGFNGATTQKDLKTLLELLYLYFEHPKFDKDAYSRLIGQYKNELANAQNNSEKIFQDTISQLNSNHNERVPLFNEALIGSLDFDKADRIYRDRFHNAADFTFFFAGNLPENTLEMVQQYIGSISSTGKTENFSNEKVLPADGFNKRMLLRELEVPKASVYVKFVKEAPYSYKNELVLHIMSQLLSKKYREIIREGEGGSYGVLVKGFTERLPENSYSLIINFDGNPDKQEKLTKVVYDQIDLMAKETPKTADIAAIKSTMIKSRAEQVLSNNYWIGKLNSIELMDEEYLNDSIFKETLEKITASDIKSFAKEFFSNPKAFEAVMKSKEKNTN
ncbi:insulinase family protein [Flavobacterium sp. DGU38]|uniref:Insulinase family protein n=1 Tax=Flavobacterium calami TaxID=3139144 RepID=A0ABU9INW9_9FLAO